MNIKRLFLLIITTLIFIQLILSKEAVFSFPDIIVIYGDNRSGHAQHRKIVNAILKVEPDIVFNTGDLVNDGASKYQWSLFESEISKILKISQYYPVIGNHEAGSELYFQYFDLPENEQWYSINKNEIHFIILNSNANLNRSSEQYHWLENDLKNMKKDIKFTVVLMHHPLYTTGFHEADEKGFRKSLEPLFSKYGVDLVFSGHNHSYERSVVKNIYYIITGGGGAPLYKKESRSSYNQVFIEKYHFCKLSYFKGSLVIEVLDTNLKNIDQFQVKL